MIPTTTSRTASAETGAPSHFSTEHLEANLRGRSVRGGVVTLGAQGLGLVIKLGSLAVLARLLTPEAFGLVFTVTAFINIIGSFEDLGLSTATLQRAEIDQRQVSNLFWINVTMALGVCVATVLLAPLVVKIYGGDHRLLPIILAYAALSVFDGFSVQHQALLRRQMRLTAVATIDTLALAVSRAAAIAVACYGGGYWALVVQAAVQKGVATVSSWVACGWRPGLPTRGAGIRSMLTFGCNLAGVRLIQRTSGSVDKLLLRGFVGTAATGIYGNAERLFLLTMQNLTLPLGSVVLPALSRLQRQPERFCAYYRRAMGLLATVAVPLIVFAFVAAEAIVRVALGPQWLEAATVFRILAPGAVVGTFSPVLGWVYAALGRTDRQMRWVTGSSVVRMGVQCVGAFWGMIGITAATSIAICTLWLPGTLYCFRESPLRLRDLLQAIWRPTLASLAAGALLGVAREAGIADGPRLLPLLTELSLFSVVYLAVWLAIPGGQGELRQIVQLGNDLRRGRRGAGTARGDGGLIGDPA